MLGLWEPLCFWWSDGSGGRSKVVQVGTGKTECLWWSGRGQEEEWTRRRIGKAKERKRRKGEERKTGRDEVINSKLQEHLHGRRPGKSASR